MSDPTINELVPSYIERPEDLLNLFKYHENGLLGAGDFNIISASGYSGLEFAVAAV